MNVNSCEPRTIRRLERDRFTEQTDVAIAVTSVRSRRDEHCISVEGSVDAILDPAEQVARGSHSWRVAVIIDVPGRLSFGWSMGEQHDASNQVELGQFHERISLYQLHRRDW